jgi:glutamate synthase (NADPH) large chain
VVLGPTGRNFAAGMSGGIAYVLDADDTFAMRLNTDMVELDELDDDDRSFLLATVHRHRVLTSSAVAERLLADWDNAVDAFRKVMPTDYKRVLAVTRDAQAAGLDEAATQLKVMESSHG